MLTVRYLVYLGINEIQEKLANNSGDIVKGTSLKGTSLKGTSLKRLLLKERISSRMNIDAINNALLDLQHFSSSLMLIL